MKTAALRSAADLLTRNRAVAAMVKHNTDTNGIGYEWEYAKVKDDRTIWQKIIMGIYNPSSHEFLGRSAKSWGEYIIMLIIDIM